MAQIPEKSHYKLSEVCQYTDTQPYVLRFWESEFPQLRAQKSPNGQRVYTRETIDLVQRIKRMLDHESRSIAEARDLLDSGAADETLESDERTGTPEVDSDARSAATASPAEDAAAGEGAGNGASPRRHTRPSAASRGAKAPKPDAPEDDDADESESAPARLPIIEAAEQKQQSFDGVARARYEDALEEISTLRLRVQELETSSRRLQTRVEQLESLSERERSRAERGIESLQEVLDLLESPGGKA